MAVIAITGGTGFLGGHLARELVARGHLAKILARGISKRDDDLRNTTNIAFAPVSVDEEKQLVAQFGGCDAVCHLVGINREQKPGDFERVHVKGTRTVVSAANLAQVKKIVLVSYLRARPSQTSKYLDTKWQAEEIVRNSGIDFTIIKPGMIYGQGDQMITNIIDGLQMFPLVGFWPTVGLLEKPVNPIFVADVVEILIAALVDGRMSKQTVAVIGPEQITLTGAAMRVAKAMKKPVIPVPMPVLGQYLLAMWMERTMTEPLASPSQVGMLAEGMNKPLPGCDLPPQELAPVTKFTPEAIRLAVRGA
jgi:uncharacterized protein YbjT (DUF2867 family)